MTQIYDFVKWGQAGEYLVCANTQKNLNLQKSLITNYQQNKNREVFSYLSATDFAVNYSAV